MFKIHLIVLKRIRQVDYCKLNILNITVFNFLLLFLTYYLSIIHIEIRFIYFYTGNVHYNINLNIEYQYRKNSNYKLLIQMVVIIYIIHMDIDY